MLEGREICIIDSVIEIRNSINLLWSYVVGIVQSPSLVLCITIHISSRTLTSTLLADKRLKLADQNFTKTIARCTSVRSIFCGMFMLVLNWTLRDTKTHFACLMWFQRPKTYYIRRVFRKRQRTTLNVLHCKGRLITTVTASGPFLYCIQQFSIPVPFLYSETSRPTAEAHSASYSMVTGGSFPGVKMARAWSQSLNSL
jgi:hypothetical protein